MLPSGFSDIATKGMYRIHETDSFIKLELENSGVTRASNIDEAGDVIMQGGSLNGLSLDPMGLSHNAIIGWSQKFNRNFNKFKNSIDEHFAKIHTPSNGRPPLDKVVIDFKYMDDINPNLKQNVLDYIEVNYPQYNNSTYLIKLNL